MIHKLKWMLAACVLTLSAVSVQADPQDALPDIGTTAAGTLTIPQEMNMGDYYLRQLRGGAPLIYDPLLTEYINQLGQRLVKRADGVKTPFNFLLINNDEINAFAFFGGNVVLHSALFKETDNESQLASVVAHEIAHVTQRHLARAMESQKKSMPLTWAGALGSILIAMASPEAGMAALTSTMAGSQQSSISFTQSNEQEADRLGIKILARAGFDPQDMPNFMQKLSDKYRYMSKPPEILLTHPLPDSRLSDTRNRANQLSRVNVNSSADYYFAKLRVQSMYTRVSNPAFTEQLINQLAKGDNAQRLASQYGQALQAYKLRNYGQAKTILTPLLASHPNNIWFIDLMTDVELEQGQAQSAVSRLEQAQKRVPNNPVIQINLANAYIKAMKLEPAKKLLTRYTYSYPSDVTGWDLLATIAGMQNKQDELFAARAEIFTLMAQFDQAINQLTMASKMSKNGSLQQARYDARIDQIRAMQSRFKQL